MTELRDFEFDFVDASDLSSVGQPLPRREDLRLLTGRGRFTDDFNAEGQAHAVIVRSPYPHALIKGIDASAALAMPGVVAVYTGEDCAADGLKPIPHSPVPSTRSDLKLTAPDGGAVYVGPHAVLPTDRVRHVGAPVAMVVAETREQATAAAENVWVDYEPLASVSQSADAVASGAPVLWDDVPDNICVDTRFGDAAATDAAFAKAAHTIAMEFPVQRVTGVPLEPRAALGHGMSLCRYSSVGRAGVL